MNKEEFLISTNIIYQSLNSNEINAYSKKQLEQNYSIDIESYVSSKSTLAQLLNEKGNLNDFIHIIFSIIDDWGRKHDCPCNLFFLFRPMFP